MRLWWVQLRVARLLGKAEELAQSDIPAGDQVYRSLYTEVNGILDTFTDKYPMQDIEIAPGINDLKKLAYPEPKPSTVNNIGTIIIGAAITLFTAAVLWGTASGVEQAVSHHVMHLLGG